VHMATEPEPQSTGVGNNLSMSTEAQLNAFRARLDGEKISTIKVIPGFLFRNGKEREVRSFHGRGVMVYSLDWADDCLVPKDDEFLLEKHTETYRKGLEARDQLLDRINVVEILGMVRDIWGRGEIRHEGSKAVLWCNYTFTKEEIKGIDHPGYISHGTPMGGDYDCGPRTEYYRTGKWLALSSEVREQIRVDFGNMKFPEPQNLPGNETNPYKGFASENTELREFFLDFYQGLRVTQHISNDTIPKQIWYRPDNLVIWVTVPSILVPYYDQCLTDWGYRSDSKEFTWFDQSTSQQEIMDYLSGKLEALRIAEQLPPQVEALELAKIGELRKRGLLVEK